jgi:hypothetical protein
MKPTTRNPETETETGNGEVELALPLDMLCALIALAREYDVKGESTDPNATETEDDDIAIATLEDRPSDPVEEELRQIIDDLSEDAQLDLVALMWLGRNDWTPDDWAELRRTAAQEHTGPTVEYLLGTPLLSDYLTAALAMLGLDCEEILAGHA